MFDRLSEASSFVPGSLGFQTKHADARTATFSRLPTPKPPAKPSRTLKICILVADFVGPIRNGGVGTAYRYLAEFLVEHGHTVTVLYTPGDYCENGKIQDWIEFYRALDIDFVPLPDTVVPATKGPIGTATRASYLTYEWLKTRNFDLIHVSEWQAVGYFSLVAKSLGLAFQNTVFCVKASSPMVWARIGGGRPLVSHREMMISYMERRSMELADIAVSGSLHLLRWMLEQGYNLKREQCYVQPNLMSTTTLPPRDNKPDIGQRIPIEEIVFFGRLELRKGLHVFCYALNQLVRAGITPKKIVFLGKTVASFPAQKFIRQQSSNWPKEMEWQIISDFDQPQALRFLQEKSRLAVIPSLLENSSFAIYECLNYAIAFIASDRGGNPELVAQKDHESILFSPHPNALSNQLAAVLKNGALIAEPSFDFDKNQEIWKNWHAGLGREGEIKKYSTTTENIDKNTDPPLVSVCLAHYERPKLVHQAIASLKQQTYKNFEVILVDDGSHSPDAKDNLAVIEKDFRQRGWKVVYQENLYLGASRNTAARNAKGKYLLFMDDDNFAKEHEIETFVEIAESCSADILTCFSDAFKGSKPPDQSNVVHRVTPIGADIATGMFLNVFGDSNCFVRRSAFEKLGGFTEDFGVGLDDQEFFARAILSGLKFEVVPEALYYYRLPVGKGLKRMHYNSTAGRLRVLRPYMDRAPSAFKNVLLYSIGLESRSNNKRKLGKLANNPKGFFADSPHRLLRSARHFYGDNLYGRINTKVLRWFLAKFVSNDL